MKNSRKNRGFSLAEMLIVVAIVIVLAGVSFVGVQRHQRSMTRLEFDTIAKEIFIAAQNHLTAAEGQGYMQKDQYGNVSNLAVDKKGGVATGETVAYFAVKGDGKSEDALNIMLPNYAIDGMIAAGTYIIRYQPSSATVLDVFYSMPGKSSFLTLSGVSLGTGDYESLMGIKDDRSARQSYNGGVVGYYGGGEIVDRGERLAVPTFEIENAERLIVRVTDPNSELKFASLKLIITGEKSGEEKQKVIPLVKDGTPQTGVANTRVTSNDKNTLYTIVLDDITTDGMHFSELNTSATDGLIPGEDINVKVIAYSNTKLTNIAISPEKKTNSLFADPIQKAPSAGENYTGSDLKNKIAGIANIRHLENLEADVSSVSTSLNIEKAKQITDLSWTDFMTKIGNAPNTQIYYKSGSSFTGTGLGCYYPVSPEAALEYDGQNHSTSNVQVNHTSDAGLFGKLNEFGEEGSKTGCTVMNLELIDFDVTASSGNAGALVGSAASTTITNVLAHNSSAYETKKATDISNESDAAKKAAILQDVTAPASGNAGGLIGSATNCTVSKSAAALIINGGGNAGGLIGTSSGGTVSLSYSGGHTYSGIPKYTGTQVSKYEGGHASVYPVRYYDANNDPMYNVTATGTSGIAGGLIGNAGSTAISYSYSTCSASGATAGGLIGTGTGEITNCYCTGLVDGTTVGAFAGTKDVNIASGKTSYYFEIVNEIRNKDKDGNLTSGYSYLTPVPDTESVTGIQGFDKEDTTSSQSRTAVQVYNSFTGDTWQTAHPYDSGLTRDYNGKYNLKTVAQLEGSSSTVTATDFVFAHYGDWPAPEEFIFN